MSSSNLVLAGMSYSGSCHGAYAHDRELLLLLRYNDILFKNFLFLSFESYFNAFFNEMLYFYATEPFEFACCYAHSKHERTCRRD